ncbi:MAG: sodium:proline symporter [Halapricum sp.]
MIGATAVLALATVTLALSALAGVLYSRGRVESVESFVTTRDSVGSGMLTATLIASAMGVWILFSPAQAGAEFGGLSAAIGYAVGSALPLLAYVKLGPRIRRLIPEGHSLTEYALARYGRAMYGFVLLVSVFYMFVFLAAELVAITGAFALVGGVPRWQTAVLVGGFVLVYTGYGGFSASVFTDTLQTLLILPLLAGTAVVTVLALGGPAAVQHHLAATDPSLLDPGFWPGVEFGVYTSIGVLGAEMLNQTWWQRIFAAENDRTLRRSFLVAAVANFALVLLAGLLGVIAAGEVTLGQGGYVYANAYFALVFETLPSGAALVVALLALLLVVSTVDTLYNAIASIVTADLPRFEATPAGTPLKTVARAFTAVVAAGAVWVSLQTTSVLDLFFLADVLAAAVMVPLLLGLYSRSHGQVSALTGGVAGLAVGLAYFPLPLVRGPLAAVPVLGGWLPEAGFLYAFVGAAGLSTAVSIVGAWLGPESFEFSRLELEIRSLDEVVTDGGQTADGDREVRDR